MRNIINYFYNLNVENLRMIGDDYYFSCENKKFIFQKIKDLYFDYKSILELNRILNENNKSIFQIIMNKSNSVITIVSSQKYILMVDNCLNDRQFDLNDILNTNIPVYNGNKHIDRLNKSNWIDMWKNKIDYFELFINHNINRFHVLSEYANYFIGLGENAILYVKSTLDEVKPSVYDNLVICHKRISNNNSFKELYNPVNLIIDHQSRDISEYLKMIFLNNQINNVEHYFAMVNISDYGARLIMARMLFPSFFFDMFEKMVDEKITINELFYLIEKMDSYEHYLLKIYNILKEKYNIPEINWLKKVDYSSTLITPNTSGTSFIRIDSIPSLSVTSIMLQ